MTKVLVDRKALEEAAELLEMHSSSSGSAEWFAAGELRDILAQPVAMSEVITDNTDTLHAALREIDRLRAENDALKAQRGEAVVPAQWSKSLGSCWPFDEEDPQGDWSIGTIDEDGNRYEVVRVEASQYDADGESQKIAEAIVKLWGSAALAQPVAPAAPPATDALVEALENEFPIFDDEGLDEIKHHCEWALLQDRKRLHQLLATYRASQRKESTCR
ncbi:hypothetical protein [Stutzerimonas stutzeri]|uniref:hypothetical protein n=1 Tax=Stutzerimonas stutzeri TaxID=316 RepID=UPI000C9B9B81|nr:hypothetical protein [Stutzerimonas stutzeri]PNG11915.1 hypothetical protein CXK97_19540 [Stutzerimonas stutzeri]